MKVDPEDPRPVYERIADDFRRLITTGALRAGDQLPSLADIRAQYDVATMTAREAIKVLTSEGLVFVRQGSGAFVADTEAKAGTSESPADLARQLHRIEGILTELDTRVAAIEHAIGHGETSRSPQDDPHDS